MILRKSTNICHQLMLILVYVGISCGSFESLIHSRSRWMCKVGEYEQAAMCL